MGTRTGRAALIVLAMMLLGWAVGPARGQTVIFVDASATGAGDGSSWLDAYTSVQPALDAATSGQQVWVAAGRYAGTITLKNGVALYGGFAGVEDPAVFSLAERDLVGNVTVLDGNEGGSVVVLRPGATAATRIDGFTVTRGIGSGFLSNRYGGGVYLPSGCSATVANNVITGNRASSGGGLYLYSSAATIVNNAIIHNAATKGAGLYGQAASPTIANNTIADNHASSSGGGLHWAGGSPVIANTIVAFNSSGVAWEGSGTPLLRHNCVYGNTAYAYSGVADPTGSDGSIAEDPRLAGLAYGKVHIQPDSPCLDGGTNAWAIGEVDLYGQARVQPAGETVDIGADESDGLAWPPGPYVIVRVSPAGDDGQDGSSWALAKRTVQAGIDRACALGGEVWVQAGTYYERIMLHPYAYVYGGFRGGETERDEREWRANVAILDGQRQGSVVTAVGGNGARAIDGFTITNGRGTAFSYRTRCGGGLYVEDCSPTIANNTITGNVAWCGGGLFVENSLATIVGNTIIANSAGGWSSAPMGEGGGGLYLYQSSATVVNNTITGNDTISGGGGLYLDGSSPTIENTIIAFNRSGICRYGTGSEPVLRHNCVYGNGSNYSGMVDQTGAGGNISAEPRFVRDPDPGPDGWWGGGDDDYGDVHLRWISPAIDGGTNGVVAAGAVDLDGRPRVLGGRVDMGAYEFGIGDFNGDRQVDGEDAARWAECMTGPGGGPGREGAVGRGAGWYGWGGQAGAPAATGERRVAYGAGCEAFDFEADGDVDLRDFAGFLGVFLRDRRGDFDGDGDIDLDDYGPMAECLYGPGGLIPDALASDCLSGFDFEGDGDVDLGDFAAFQVVFGGV